MKPHKIYLLSFILLISLTFLFSCSDNTVTTDMNNPAGLSHTPVRGKQFNLVSDIAEYNPRAIDPALTNAWGIAQTPEGLIWVAANHSSSVIIYDNMGNQWAPPVGVPGANGKPGEPTGIIYNTTSDFKLNGIASKILIAGEDGTISAWYYGASATIVADRSASSTVYKGLAIGQIGGVNYLFAADFHNSKIDVYDKDFNYIKTSTGFQDPNIEEHWGPFNIVSNPRGLFVSYAKQLPPEYVDDDPAPGRGVVDIYDTQGNLIQTFASHGHLNSPWGMVAVNPPGNDGNVYIGNFGDGKINIYSNNGIYLGQVMNMEHGTGSPTEQHGPLSIEGLWGLMFLNGKLYFAAGPDDEVHGIFGYIDFTIGY